MMPQRDDPKAVEWRIEPHVFDGVVTARDVNEYRNDRFVRTIATGLDAPTAKLIAAALDMRDALVAIAEARAPHRSSMARDALKKAGQ